jgi:hypothetical protein
MPSSPLHRVLTRRPTAATRWRMSRFRRLQSIGGALRLPLLQNGACDFRLTPLLSMLMLVTQTWRERGPLLPRLRIVAVSMQRLQVRRARITVVTIAMVHLNPVVMVEAQSTTATASVLLCEPPGQSCTDVGVAALSRAPVDPVPLRGTAVALDLHMPGHGHLAVGQQGHGIGVSGRGGTGETGAYAMPVPPDGPGGGCPRVSPACPVAERDPGEVIEPGVDGVAHSNAGVVGPSPHGGVALADQLPLRQGLPALDEPSKRGAMVLHLDCGGCDQGCEPETPMASRAFACLVCADPILPDVQSQTLTPGLIAFSGLPHAPFGFMQASSPLSQPRLEHLLTVLKHLSLFVEPHPSIGRGDDTGVWGDAGDGLVHPMQRDQRQERCTAPALGRPCGGGSQVAIVEQTRCEPGLQWSAAPRGRLHLRHECLLIDPLEACRPIQFEPMVRSKPAGGTEGADGIRAGPSWATARGVRCQCGFPCRFQGLAHERLPCPVRVGWHAQWALVRP